MIIVKKMSNIASMLRSGCLLVFILLTGFYRVNAYDYPEQDQSASAGIRFIENKGQWPANILLRADIPGGKLFVEKTALTYYFYDQAALHDALHTNFPTDSMKGHVVKVHFKQGGANTAVDFTNATPEYYNFIIGNDQSKWVSNVRGYKKAVLRNV
ncbi:MAG: hypothetical protein M3Q97_01235, partial [Bacteroidota bacterium]|nr:hypothetical protein [Bacteroidota bacterium]